MLLDKIAFSVLEIQYFLWKLEKGSNITMQSKACSPAVKNIVNLVNAIEKSTEAYVYIAFKFFKG